MTLRMRIITGGLLLALMPGTAAAIETSLYRRMREITEHELLFKQAELSVERFVPKIYPEPSHNVEEEDIARALRREHELFCTGEQEAGTVGFQGTCTGAEKNIRKLATQTQWIRTVGRDLQSIATSYEAPLDDIMDPTGQSSLLLLLASILNIWQSDAERYGSVAAGSAVSVESTPEGVQTGIDAVAEILRLLVEDVSADDVLQNCIKIIGNETVCDAEYGGGKKQDIEKLTGAVWRYRYGYQQVRDAEGQCENSGQGDGTELQYLRARWCDLEDALDQIRGLLQSDGGVVSYHSAAIEDIGVIVWMRSDDVGLAWSLATEPVLPSLDCTDATEAPMECVDTAILGGTYPDPPPEPPPGTGLCGQPFGRQSYLCRPLEGEWCPSPAPLPEGSVFSLTECRIPPFTEQYPGGPPIQTRLTESGPNMCTPGGWRLPPITPEEKALEEKCKNCSVEITCGECAGSPAEVYPKNPERVIEVCINEGVLDVPTKYATIFGLALAQSACNVPGRPEGSCCTLNWQPNLVMCNAMVEDGVLDGMNVTPEECATALTNSWCDGEEECLSAENAEGADALTDRLYEAMGNNPEKNISGCSEDPEQLDPRAQMLYSSMPGICSAECLSRYSNSIGNNLCYLGQCLEQSFEEHRMIPGRMTMNEADQAFGYDAMTGPDAENGRILAVPPLLRIALPTYNPGRLVGALDQALCQLNGLPALTPPALCAFDARRKLELSEDKFTAIVQGALSQSQEQQIPARGLEEMAQSVGARIGGKIYVEYLQLVERNLRTLLAAATTIVKDIGGTELSRYMCTPLFTGTSP